MAKIEGLIQDSWALLLCEGSRHISLTDNISDMKKKNA